MSPQRSERGPPPAEVARRQDALIEEMRKRIVTLPEVGTFDFDAGFDPMDPALDLGTCLRIGIPPRPTEEKALALWLRMVAPPLRIKPFHPDDVTLRGDIGHRFAFRVEASGDGPNEGQEQAGAVLTGGGRLSSSANWSGAAILPRDGERFVQVLATWTVPAVAAGEGDGPWACSTWIGLDGLRRWMGSMPQMGTTQSAGRIDGQDLPPNFAWFQWWLRGRGVQEPVPLNQVPIKTGDTIYCAVTRLPRDQPTPGAEHHVQFFLKVNGVAVPPIVKEPPTDAPDDKVASRGASAQWILERPTALKPSPNGHVRPGDLFPLPDFGTTGDLEFAASMAPSPVWSGVTDAAKAAAPANFPARTLRTPRLLRMVQALPDPPRIAVIAKPTLDADGRLTVRYRRP
ncbi:G1 family glutamic endopeptidase [Roseomonas sp. HF4]|uniref:G1 family glutamic endopeptidase n=1 Tax=Roseomonas sp. HF4 TaxID=2562313 RepID=UPI0010C01AC8|nr:G1 family glutamic endopeptidase [Roseomonas sp. HF4]